MATIGEFLKRLPAERRRGRLAPGQIAEQAVVQTPALSRAGAPAPGRDAARGSARPLLTEREFQQFLEEHPNLPAPSACALLGAARVAWRNLPPSARGNAAVFARRYILKHCCRPTATNE